MSFVPTSEELLSRARNDLRVGLPVVATAGPLRAIALAAETITDERLTSLRDLGHAIHLTITARRAETLRAHAYDGDLARIILPADAGARWVHATANPARDLATPLKGPYETERKGDSAIHRMMIELTKQAQLLPAAIVALIGDEQEDAPDLAGLTRISLADFTRARPEAMELVAVADARVPLEVSESGRVHVFRPLSGGIEHYAIEIGSPPRNAPVLSRLHSACFTGDLIGSLKCDCGPQLRAALAQIGEEGSGVLLYLNQEGRGIGLANKMRAYSLQDQGFDTVEANHRLGFEDDERDFRIGGEILKALGFGTVRLMTNNPNKIQMMNATGLQVVERVPLKVGQNPYNVAYLNTKAKKSGHLL